MDHDPYDAIAELQHEHGIEHIDCVIANAGIEKFFGPVATVPLDELRDHFEVNSLAPLALFQATWPLLQKSQRPIFVPISSRLGSMSELSKVKVPAAVYGASKAMLNYLTCKMHLENPSLIAFPLSPGFVQTDMGSKNSKKAGIAKALTVEQSVSCMLETVSSNDARECHVETDCF